MFLNMRGRKGESSISTVARRVLYIFLLNGSATATRRWAMKQTVMEAGSGEDVSNSFPFTNECAP